jgi:hypothetical protein
MIFKYEPKEGTYGAFLNHVIIGPKTRITEKIVNQKINRRKKINIIVLNIIIEYIALCRTNKTDF